MKASETTSTRREPRQKRSRQTVDAVLEAVRRVLKRQGADAITTNRVAEAAGVSIGSLYQYFPNKQAIYVALHDRHVDEVRHTIEQTKADCATAPLETFSCELVERLARVHAADDELHELISAAVPASADGFRNALQATFAQQVRSAQRSTEDASRMLFVLPQLVVALVHGVAHQKQGHARGRATDEAIRTIAAYLHSPHAQSA